MSEETIGTSPVSAPRVRPVPRFALRTFWTIHRAIVRLTGGRMGLTRPETGAKFGMMRLQTLGRRSGQARVAMVGYYEDGTNLVTMAMNGWGRSEPAWWLNLQANPDATVDLPDGPRPVRARVASGEERSRLWARFVDYPGWGTDIDALAASRPGETAVVVLEARDVAGAARRGDALAATASTSGPGDGQNAAVAAPTTGRSRRVRPRHLWLIPGIALALFANAQASTLAVGLVPLLVFSIVPDFPRLVGTRRPAMLAIHNATHSPALALAVLLVSAVTGMSAFVYVGALAWLGHIVVGWGTGDRIRSAIGSATTTSRGIRPDRIVPAPVVATGASR